jgi:hypothetical protein
MHFACPRQYDPIFQSSLLDVFICFSMPVDLIGQYAQQMKRIKIPWLPMEHIR